MIYHFGDCDLDIERRELRRQGDLISIDRQVFVMLCYLIEHRDQLVTRQELLAACWPETHVSDESLTRCMSRVRKAIGQLPGAPELIHTVYGTGYRFVGDISSQAAPQVIDDIADMRSPSPAPSSMDPPATLATPSPVSSPNQVGSVVAPERRHVSILNCSLLEPQASPSFADPEAMYDRTKAIQRVCASVMSQFEGYVTRQQDDELVAYFGYPQAHEDDAHRAIRSGLELVARLRSEVEAATMRSEPDLRVRVGIHTGVLIVEPDATAGPAVLPLAVGSVPKQAERVRQQGRADTVVISEATAQLVEGYFELKPLTSSSAMLGPDLTPMAVYEVRGLSPLQTHLEVRAARGLTPFVGRAAELELLRERWALVQEGLGQVVWLRGEAGIGKSRLVQAWQEHMSEIPLALACHCSPYHQNTLFYPVVRMLQQGIAGGGQTSETDQLERLEALLRTCPVAPDESVPLLAGLLSLKLPAERYAPLPLSSERQRSLILETLVSVVLSQASTSSLLLVVEDVHWADPSTLAFLELLFEQVSLVPLLVVVSSRAEFEAPWSQQLSITSALLSRLTRSQTEALIGQMAVGKRLPQNVVEQLIEKTDGVPLYVEELTRMVLEADGLRDQAALGERQDPELSLTIPVTLRDASMARLDQLGAAKELAQWGAVLGREFDYEVLAQVSPYDAPTTQALLRALVGSGLVLQQGLLPQARFRFKHALIQNAAYDSLLRRRRQAMHEQIAHLLEAHFANLVEMQPELVAHHHTEAGCAERALLYWRQAAKRAIESSAAQEAQRYLSTALELLAALPESVDRQLLELELQMSLGPILMIIEGQASPEVQRVYVRAHQLCQQMGDGSQLFSALWGLWRFYNNRPQLAQAQEIGEQLFNLTERLQDTGLRMQAHIACGVTFAYQGVFNKAKHHLDCAMAHYDPSQHRALAHMYGGQDLEVFMLSNQAHVLWRLGFPDQAATKSHQALVLARRLAHPSTLAYALNFAGVVHELRREAERVQALMAEQFRLVTEHGFLLWQATGTIMQGWAWSELGQVEAGVAHLRAGLEAHVATGAELALPYWYRLLTEALCHQGAIREGLTVTAEALARISDTGEGHMEAEVNRLQGELHLRQEEPDMNQATMCFFAALDIARQQQSKSLELRAAMSLTRLWRQQDRRQDAYDLLASIYDWFTEGFDTADLKDAKSLLFELAPGQ